MSAPTAPVKRARTSARVGKPAPHWQGKAVVDEDITDLSIDDFKGKYLVLFFYPGDFTFVCPMEVLAISSRIKEFRDINAEVVGCSVDSVYCHYAWVTIPQKAGGLGPISFPLLSDITKSISRDYDVLADDGEHAGTALRGLFIIHPNQEIKNITVNFPTVARNVDEALRLIKACQFVDEHGDDLCPANLQPGAQSTKPGE